MTAPHRPAVPPRGFTLVELTIVLLIIALLIGGMMASVSATRDVAASALVLNFVADRDKALAEMKRAVRPGGRIGFYVWDYPGGGQQFVRAFWEAATQLDPEAAQFAEGRRFPYCTPEALHAMASEAGLAPTALSTLPTVT